MAIPKMNIPVGYDLSSFEQQSAQMSSKVGGTIKGIGQLFTRVNGEMLGVATASAAGAGLAWSQAAARTALSFAGMATLVFAGAKVITSLIHEAQQQIAEMVQIAEKAQNIRLSPETFQAFTKSAGTAVDKVKELEEGLTHFQDKNKAALDPNAPVGEIEQYKRKVTELEQLIGGLRIDLLANRDAADQFLHALSDDEKVRATLGVIQQLFEQGQKLEALDLAEKAFGSKFADNLRNGKNEITQIVANFDRLKAATGDEIFSSNTVARAKEVNDKLEEAHRLLHDNMHPAIETVSRALLGVKDLWADIVDLIAQAAGLIPKVPQAIPLSGPISGNVEEQIAALRSKLAGDRNMREGLMSGLGGDMMGGDLGALEKLNADITKTEARLAQLEAHLVAINGGAPGLVPLPRMRPANAPGPEDKDDDEGKRDRFDSASDAIAKRTAMLEAETAHINENTAARERAKIVAELEAVARQVAAEKGVDENKFLEENRKRIDDVADAYGRARQAAADAHAPLASFIRESANLNMAFNKFAAEGLGTATDATADFIIGAKKGSEAFHDVVMSIERDLARLLLRKYLYGPIGSMIDSWLPSANGGGSGGGGGGGGKERSPSAELASLAGPIMPTVAPSQRGGGNRVQNNFMLQPNMRAEHKSQRDEGGMEVNDYIISTVDEGITSHKLNGAFGTTYGAQPRLTRR